MKIIYDYLQDPIYVPPDSRARIYQPIDYDKDKRLIVWRTLAEYIASTPEKTEVLSESQVLCVSPNGDVEKSAGTHIAKHVFYKKSNVRKGDFKYFLVAAGFGFSDYIDVNNMDLIKMPDKGQMKINSRGTFGKNKKGTWALTVDPNSDFFVREASFMSEGNNRNSIKVSTFDVVEKGELKYARQSHVIHVESFARDYVDIDISVRDNYELRQEVDQHVWAPLPSGSEIIHFTEGKPTRETIK